MHNDLHLYLQRSFSHDFVIKLLKYGTSCHFRSTAHTVLDGFFPYLAQMITSMRGCVSHAMTFDLWLISSRSFSHDFAIKLLKYGISWSVRSITSTVLHGFCPCRNIGFFSYLAPMITSIRGCVMQWPWPISSRLFSCDVAYFMDFINVAQIQPMKGRCVTHHFSVNRSKVKITQAIQIFAI